MESNFCSSWHLTWLDPSSKYVFLAVGSSCSVCQFFHLPAGAFVPGQLRSPPPMQNSAVRRRLGWVLYVYFVPQFLCSSQPGFPPKQSGCSVSPTFCPLTPQTSTVAREAKARADEGVPSGRRLQTQQILPSAVSFQE